MRFWLLLLAVPIFSAGLVDADPIYTESTTSKASPASYSETDAINFSVKWTNPATPAVVPSVMFEHNFTGTLKNDTVLNNTPDAFKFSIIPGAGTHVWRWHANSSATDWNSTSQSVFIVDKAAPSITLTLDGASGDQSFNKGVDVTIEAKANSSLSISVMANFSGNMTVLKSGAGQAEHSFDTSVRSLGKYNVTANTSSNANFTGGSLSRMLSVIDNEDPKISLATDSVIVAGQNSNISYEVTDNDNVSWVQVNVTNPNNNITSYNFTSSRGSITFSSTSAVGVYKVLVLAQDPSGNLENDANVFRTVTATDPNIISVTKDFNLTIETDKTTPFVSLKITAKSNVTGKVSVRRASVPGIAPEGVVYWYVEAVPEGFSSSDVSSAEITFEVPSSWMAENDITQSTIALYLLNGTWQELPTTKVSSANGIDTYVATSPTLSTYAIAGQRPLPPVVGEESGEEKGGFRIGGGLIAAIIVIAAIPIAVLIFLKRRTIAAFFKGLATTAQMNYRKLTGPNQKKVTKKLTKIQDQMWSLRSEGKRIDDIKINVDQAAIALKSGDFEAADYYLFEAAKLLKIRKARLFGL